MSVTAIRSTGLPWVPLVHRLVLFAAFQLLVALVLAATGTPDPIGASAGWWVITATLTNLVSIGLLVARADEPLREVLHLDGRRIGRDLLVLLGVLVVAAPAAQLPNLGLATLLFGSPEAALELFVRPIPRPAAVAGLVLFPVTIALAELPTYYADAMPRLERAGFGRWGAVAVAAVFHSLQHATLPLVPDARFVLWRALMFLPFALVVGTAVRARPSLLPWLMVVHGLLDFGVAWMVFAASV